MGVQGAQGLIGSQVGDLGRWRRCWAGPGPALIAGPSCPRSAQLGEWGKTKLKEILQPYPNKIRTLIMDRHDGKGLFGVGCV